jgi:hypothetical protein
VTCPTTSGTSLSPKSGQATSNNAVYCRPRSADGSPVTVTITLRGRSNAPVNYGVFAQSLNQSTVSSFDGLNLEGVGINPRVIALYRIPNSDSSLQQRNLSFTPSSTSRAAALLYRADGNLRCGTLKQRTCEIYESDWTDYYMVVANAGDSSFTYDVKFTRP